MSLLRRSLVVAVLALVPAGATCAGQTARPTEPRPGCPIQTPTTVDAATTEDPRVHISADRGWSKESGTTQFFGNVRVRRGALTIESDELSYNQPANQLSAAGHIKLMTAQGDMIEGPQLRYWIDTDTGSADNAEFVLSDNQGRGHAGQLKLDGDQHLSMDGLSYTTCPPGNEDWMMRARNLEMDRTRGLGTARHVVLDFKGVPIFYSPYFSFPLTDARQSGVLIPTFGISDRLGASIALPYYINLDPQYDDTLTPRLLSRRGLQVLNEFRYLGMSYKGQIDLEYLPQDQVYGDTRSYYHLQHNQQFGQFWTGNVDVQAVSDNTYLIDFGETQAATSATYLARTAKLGYSDGDWRFGVRLTNLQTLDTTILSTNQPYERVPQLTLATTGPERLNRLNFDLDSEWTYFNRADAPVGTRFNAKASVSLPWRNNYAYFVPRVGLYHTDYSLIDAPDTSPTRDIGYTSVDTGLVLERGFSSKRGWTQTLEPRLYYLHIPYVDQSDLPVFDTALPDFSFYNLFRDNRYVGGDRVGDTRQLALAVTNRLLDRRGVELARLSLGEVLYFADQRVDLPPVPPALSGVGASTSGSSDLIAEIQARVGNHTYLRASAQADDQSRTLHRGSAQLHYSPSANRILSAGYRFIQDPLTQQDQQKQFDLSGQWPVTPRWLLLGRWNYSMLDNATLQSYAGLEYASCCWAFRIMSRQRTLADGQVDHGVLFELELTGLGNLGVKQESPLIPGRFMFE